MLCGSDLRGILILPHQISLKGKKLLLIFPRRSYITVIIFDLLPYLYPLELLYQWLGLLCFQNKIQVQLWLFFPPLAMLVSWITKEQWAFLCFLPQDGKHTWIRIYLSMFSKVSLET